MEISELYRLYLRYPSVQTDTRKLKKNDIFFALKGGNFNGNYFAAQALETGAAYCVIDEKAYLIDDRCILVKDVLTALQQLANFHRKQFKIPFLAITGSNGKTTTKELITAVLKQQFVTYATEGNLNNHIGVPLTLLKIKKDAEMAVIEMGANHQKEIASYCEIAMPTHGIITNCGKAHIEGFGSIEGVRKAKGELYDYLRVHDGDIFRNSDLDYLEQMANAIKKQITYGSANAQYNGRIQRNGIFLEVSVDTASVEMTLKTQLVGDYNFPNVMAAVAVGLHFAVTAAKIKNAIENYNPDNSRSQLLQKGSNKIILDAYNANPTSMQAAIINFANSSMENKMLWLGGMKEMGDEEENEHRELVTLISGYSWANVILVGQEFKKVHAHYLWFENSEQAAQYVRTHQPENSSILIKGSRGSKMEKLADALTTKA